MPRQPELIATVLGVLLAVLETGPRVTNAMDNGLARTPPCDSAPLPRPRAGRARRHVHTPAAAVRSASGSAHRLPVAMVAVAACAEMRRQRLSLQRTI